MKQIAAIFGIPMIYLLSGCTEVDFLEHTPEMVEPEILNIHDNSITLHYEGPQEEGCRYGVELCEYPEFPWVTQDKRIRDTTEDITFNNLKSNSQYYYRFYIEPSYTFDGYHGGDPEQRIYSEVKSFKTPILCQFNYNQSSIVKYISKDEGAFDTSQKNKYTRYAYISSSIDITKLSGIIESTGVIMDTDENNLTLEKCKFKKEIPLTKNYIAIQTDKGDNLYDESISKGEIVYFQPYVKFKEKIVVGYNKDNSCNYRDILYGHTEQFLIVSKVYNGAGLIDLGLSSGTLWSVQYTNNNSPFECNKALPTDNYSSFISVSQFKELMDNCTVSKVNYDTALKLTGNNGNVIYMGLGGHWQAQNCYDYDWAHPEGTWYGKKEYVRIWLEDYIKGDIKNKYYFGHINKDGTYYIDTFDINVSRVNYGFYYGILPYCFMRYVRN